MPAAMELRLINPTTFTTRLGGVFRPWLQVNRSLLEIGVSLNRLESLCPTIATASGTRVHVACSGKYAGFISIDDPIRPGRPPRFALSIT